MSILRRVLLLLSVVVLLREGSSSSPLDFLRDLKNRIFTSGSTTEATEEPSLQCSGLNQDGVCILQNKTDNETQEESNNVQGTEILDSSNILNSKQGSDTNTTETDNQFEINGTAMEDVYNTNNTQYYDEQEWNSTASNNTENYRNDFEYPENEQNITDFIREASTSNGDKTRSKRQINKVEINMTLKKPLVLTSKPLTFSAIDFAGKPDNLTVNTSTNQFSNLTGERLVKTSENYTGGIQNELIAADFVNTEYENKAIFINKITNNKTKEGLLDVGDKTYESTNITLESSEYPVMVISNDTDGDFLEQQNATEEMNKSESITTVNCTNCIALEEGSMDLLNISLSLDKDLNGTEPIKSEQGKTNKNSNEVDNNNSFTSLTNITKLKGFLENSTRIIETIVQNVAPVISIASDEIYPNENNHNTLENLQNMEMKEEKNNSSETVKSKFSETDGRDEIIDRKLKSIVSSITITSEENGNTTTVTSNETFTLNLSESHPLALEYNVTNLAGINATTNVSKSTTDMKREKRGINFTILTEDDEDEPDLSISTFPGAIKSPATEITFSTVLNSTESSLLDEVAGQVCFKRYEQCTNSTDCCENYECIETEENNSTAYCDLRPVSPALPITSTNTD